jgi:DNA-binding CsgD family transcriptional regulator
VTRPYGRKPGSPLSPRQADVLFLVAAGSTYEEVGEELGSSGVTVNTHVATIRAKLGAKTTAHAVAIAYQKGLLP